MKVNLKNNDTFTAITGFNILLCAMLISLQQSEAPGSIGSLLIWLVSSVISFFLLVYLIKILAWLKESNAIIASFTTLTCLIAIEIIGLVFPFFLLHDYVLSLGILSDILGLLVVFRSFQVKNKVAAIPFKIFGGGLFLLFFPKLTIPLIATTFNEKLVAILGDTGLLLSLLGSIFILRGTTIALKAENSEALKANE